MKLMFGRKASRIQDLFQTTLYAGNSSTQDIVTGLDMANKNGLVWIKARNSIVDHFLANTTRGAGYALASNLTSTEGYSANSLTGFLSSGFSLGAAATVNLNYNYVAWSFMKGARFFDFATVTKSSGSNATVDFPKLVTLGMVIVKCIDLAGDWYVWHRSLPSGNLLRLNLKNEESLMGHITVSGTTASLIDGIIANGTYIVIAFAHDTHLSGIVQAGTYPGNGLAAGPEINLGWRPQYLLLKSNTDNREDWAVYDNKRNTSNPRSSVLAPNNTESEVTSSWDVDFTATGFQPLDSLKVNRLGESYIYVAIREEE